MRVVIRPLPPPDVALAVAAAEVHVWHFDPLAVPPADVLTPEEAARRDRYRLPRVRDQFAACRGQLRVLLGRYLGCDPRAVPLTVTPDGKPVLGGGYPGVWFNVSHTDGLAMVAVAARAVGVDVEPDRAVPNADGLVDRFFAAAERQQYWALPNDLRAEAFLRGWTCKEAVLKGVGCGVRELEKWAVCLDPRRPPQVVEPADGGWAVGWWRHGVGFSAAIAVEAEAVVVDRPGG